ncbi:MAG: GTPase Era [Ruminococcaceae bacterium]|jgi:GTP-binding protein Era|nr:GTPase Era [Oscillospiraceae bacterium]
MTRTAFIAIVGRPNVGKSTLMNHLLGEKVAIVSSKPQTTRNRISGILTKGEDQYVFLDTPGVHKARTKLGEYMMKSVRSSMGAADAVILIAEAGYPAGDIEKELIGQIKQAELPSMLVLNKIDLVNREKLAETISEYAALHSFDAVVPTCAQNGKNVDEVLGEAEQFLYEGDWMFDGDSLTDQPERQIASEIIREKVLRLLNDEIPHGVAVVIEDFRDEESILRIRAEIWCEKNSHKGIIVGKDGATLKRIGTYAREDMETFFGTKVYLNLWVKVKEKWRDSAAAVSNFGYKNEDVT